jgi:hypothetical protein
MGIGGITGGVLHAILIPEHGMSLVALGLVAEGSVRLDGNVPRIAMRVLGSWMAAIAMLVLALRIVTRIAIG